MGAARTAPELLHVLRHYGLFHSVCVPRWVKVTKSEQTWFRLLTVALFLLPRFAVTLSKIGCAASGPGCLCWASCRNWAIRYSLCCASNRWSSCTGTITSRCWSTRGSATRSTPARRVGSLWWTTVCTRWCTATMHWRQLGSIHQGSFRWSSPHCSWHRWSSVVRSMCGPMGSWRLTAHSRATSRSAT